MPIHDPFEDAFRVKIGENGNGNFLQFYASRNAISWD